MSGYGLRCRVCEEVTPPQPVDLCRRCDGPTDVVYDWERLTGAVTRAAVAAEPRSVWRYHWLLPAGARVETGAGWTPLERSDELSSLLGIELYL
jgi:hypothetical protein